MNLPAGFELDSPNAPKVPDGFVLDGEPTAVEAQPDNEMRRLSELDRYQQAKTPAVTPKSGYSPIPESPAAIQPAIPTAGFLNKTKEFFAGTPEQAPLARDPQSLFREYVADPIGKAYLGFIKGKFVNSPEFANALIQRYYGDKVPENIKGKNFDQVIEELSATNTSGFERLVGDLGYYVGALSGKTGAAMPKSATWLDKAVSEGLRFGGVEAKRQAVNLASEKVNPDVDTEYGGAGAVAAAGAGGAVFSLLGSGTNAFLSSKVGQRLVSKYPKITDALMESPDEETVKQVYRYAVNEGLAEKVDEKTLAAMSRHVARKIAQNPKPDIVTRAATQRMNLPEGFVVDNPVYSNLKQIPQQATDEIAYYKPDRVSAKPDTAIEPRGRFVRTPDGIIYPDGRKIVTPMTEAIKQETALTVAKANIDKLVPRALDGIKGSTPQITSILKRYPELSGYYNSVYYDTLVERANSNDKNAINKLNSIVQNTNLPSYDELLQRANQGDQQAVEMIQNNQYFKPNTPQPVTAGRTEDTQSVSTVKTSPVQPVQGAATPQAAPIKPQTASEPLQTGAVGEQVAPVLKDWVRQGMIEQGLTPGRVMNVIDMGRPDLIRMIDNDPIVKYLEKTNPKLFERARRGDITLDEIRATEKEMSKLSSPSSDSGAVPTPPQGLTGEPKSDKLPPMTGDKASRPVSKDIAPQDNAGGKGEIGQTIDTPNGKAKIVRMAKDGTPVIQFEDGTQFLYNKNAKLAFAKPKESAPEQKTALKPTTIKKILDGYNDGSIASISDVVQAVKELDDISPEIAKAILDYEKAAIDDRTEFGQRSGLPEDAADNLISVLEKSVNPSFNPPATAQGGEGIKTAPKPQLQRVDKKIQSAVSAAKKQAAADGVNITGIKFIDSERAVTWDNKVDREQLIEHGIKTKEEYDNAIAKGQKFICTGTHEKYIKNGRQVGSNIEIYRGFEPEDIYHEIGHAYDEQLGLSETIIGGKEDRANAIGKLISDGNIKELNRIIGEAKKKLSAPGSRRAVTSEAVGSQLSPSNAEVKSIPKESPYNKKNFQIKKVDTPVRIRENTGGIKTYEVSFDPEIQAKIPDNKAGIKIEDLKSFRNINVNPERIKDWNEIYKKATSIDTWAGVKKVNKEGKLKDVPVVSLTKGCQRALTTVERVQNGILPEETRVEACYGGDCWVNRQFNSMFSTFENMEVRDLQLAKPEQIKKWLSSKAAVEWLNKGDFIRQGQQGDDSHLFATGIASEWLKACKEAGVKPKTVFISASYAPVTDAQYKDLAKYKDMFEIHFSNSGWFHKNEIMLRLAEFQAAKDAGLNVAVRLVTNKDNVSGLKMPNEDFINDMMKKMGVEQSEVLETPFHDDSIKKKNEQKRSDPTGEWKNICCETGVCGTCGAKCMTKVHGDAPVSTSYQIKLVKSDEPAKGSKDSGFLNLEGVVETANGVVNISKKLARRLGLTGKIKDIPKASVRAKEIIGQAVAYGTAPISYRLEQISPKLSQGIRRHAFDVIMNTHRTIQRLSGLFKTQSLTHSMSTQDEDAFYEALFSRNMTEAGAIANRNGFGNDFRDALRYLDSAYQRALDNGVAMNFRSDYWPQRIKDSEGLVKYLYQDRENRSIIEDAKRTFQEKHNRFPTEREMGDIINSLIRGYKTNGVVLNKPGFSKTRRIEYVDKDMRKFYYDPIQALRLYIHDLETTVANNQFFGRVNEEFRNLKRQESTYRNRLAKYEQLARERRLTADEAEKADNAQSALDSVLREIRNNGYTDPVSAGKILNDMMRTGDIKPGQDTQAQELLKSYFNPGRMNAMIRGFMSLNYFSRLGNSLVLHNLTQLPESGLSYLEDWKSATKEVYKAFTGQSQLTSKDLPFVQHIGEDFQEISLDELVTKVLGVTMYTDKPGKVALVNTAIKKASSLAKMTNPPAWFIDRLKLYHGDDWRSVLNDLRNDELSDDVLFYGFSRLSDRQPLTKAEQTQASLQHPNVARPLSMFKTFSLRRIWSVFNDAKREFKAGRKVRGMSIAASTLALLYSMDLGANYVKDLYKSWLSGKPPKPATTQALDTAMRNLFISRYQLESMKWQTHTQVLGQALIPSTPIDDVIQAVQREKYGPLLRNIPVAGQEIESLSKRAGQPNNNVRRGAVRQGVVRRAR